MVGNQNDWVDLGWEEEAQDFTTISVNPISGKKEERTVVPETQPHTVVIQSNALDSDKIYWDTKEEFYVHTSGMCFNPDVGVKSYYTITDQDIGDFRPLYYLYSSGDFMLAIRGKLGKSNKIFLEDKTQDKRLYTQ